MSLTLAMGVPGLEPQCGVRVNGFKAEIDETVWLAVRANQALGDGGLTSTIELENFAG